MGPAGTIFLVLFIFLLIYFFGGMLIMYWRGSRGLEMIPNLGFWKELPGHVKRGVVYCFNGCRSEDSYERI